MWVPFLLLLIVFEIVADIFAKEWSLKGKFIFWFLAILSYVIANSFWLIAIRKGSGLARGAIIFSIGSAILAIIIGVVFYKEQTSKLQIAGLLTGLAAIVMLSWAEN